MPRLISYNSISDIVCFQCKGDLIMDDNCETTSEIVPDELWCISTHDYDEVFLLCTKCKCYYLICPFCSVNLNHLNRKRRVRLCKFLGHSGYFIGEDTKDILKIRTHKIMWDDDEEYEEYINNWPIYCTNSIFMHL